MAYSADGFDGVMEAGMTLGAASAWSRCVREGRGPGLSPGMTLRRSERVAAPSTAVRRSPSPALRERSMGCDRGQAGFGGFGGRPHVRRPQLHRRPEDATVPRPASQPLGTGRFPPPRRVEFGPRPPRVSHRPLIMIAPRCGDGGNLQRVRRGLDKFDFVRLGRELAHHVVALLAYASD
jgi:hypothetical protein